MQSADVNGDYWNLAVVGGMIPPLIIDACLDLATARITSAVAEGRIYGSAAKGCWYVHGTRLTIRRVISGSDPDADRTSWSWLSSRKAHLRHQAARLPVAPAISRSLMPARASPKAD